MNEVDICGPAPGTAPRSGRPQLRTRLSLGEVSVSERILRFFLLGADAAVNRIPCPHPTLPAARAGASSPASSSCVTEGKFLSHSEPSPYLGDAYRVDVDPPALLQGPRERPHSKPPAPRQPWAQDRPGSLRSLRCDSVQTAAPSARTSLFHGHFPAAASPSGARLTTSSPAGSSGYTIARKLRPSTVGEWQTGPQTSAVCPALF